MANLVLKPQVAAFLDVVSTAEGESSASRRSRCRAPVVLPGKTIRGLRVRDTTGAMVVAIRKQDGTFDATPSPDALFEAGDVVIGAGTADELRRLEDLFAPHEAVPVG